MVPLRSRRGPAGAGSGGASSAPRWRSSRRACRVQRHDARREAAQEIPWHAALLDGGLARDRVIGGHTLDQGSTYSYVMGFNGAARDPLQHALPLVYTAPELALSVLRNTCAWATPDGDLPYALERREDADQHRRSGRRTRICGRCGSRRSTRRRPAISPRSTRRSPTIRVHRAEPAPLREHLRRQLRFFVDVVGRGERGHVRILNADWNDLAIEDSGVDRGADDRARRLGAELRDGGLGAAGVRRPRRASRRGGAGRARRARRARSCGCWSRARGTAAGSIAPTRPASRRSATTTAGSRSSRGRSCAAPRIPSRPRACST